ncbi:MAG: WYL domain-containing protein, partial [Lachnospiraceae bacterium]|nr:WYL domain-containing protein [Lachnospiraceae bacterium]
KRSVPLPDLSNERIFSGGVRVKALIDGDCKWRLVEEFGMDCFTELEDGRLLFQADYTDEENLITWLLSFREKAEIVEPLKLREELHRTLLKTLENYRED